MLSGHIGTPRDGILQVKRPKNNSQGLIDMGITAGKEALEGVKALVVFGENADIDTEALEFLAVCDTHMTELGAKADVGDTGRTGFASVDGTFTNTERRMQLVRGGHRRRHTVQQLGSCRRNRPRIRSRLRSGTETDDISDEMSDAVDAYKYAHVERSTGRSSEAC